MVLTYNKRKDEAEKLVQTIRALGRKVDMVQADLTIPSVSADIVTATMDRLGGIDALINTAGWHPLFPFLDMSEKDIDYTIQSELFAVIRLARAVLPTMIKQRSGRFITVGSDSGKAGNRGAAVSSAARGGVISFTKSLAREFARHNVLANVVCPGPTDTDLWRNDIASDANAIKIQQAMIRAIPLRRPGSAREVAALAIFLVSDEAAYITGQAISVSGGLTMA
jgi:NAD(P)-dependent dehydrogenase (short-subunit alcohol dehydrogenase family)